jgi:hypothetical protein
MVYPAQVGNDNPVGPPIDVSSQVEHPAAQEPLRDISIVPILRDELVISSDEQAVNQAQVCDSDLLGPPIDAAAAEEWSLEVNEPPPAKVARKSEVTLPVPTPLTYPSTYPDISELASLEQLPSDFGPMEDIPIGMW